MKICKKPNFLFFLLFFIAKSIAALAWVGYEESTSTMIDIISDEYVDVGVDISYYDFGAEKYFNAFVTFKDSVSDQTRLEVNELETKKKRVFIMDN